MATIDAPGTRTTSSAARSRRLSHNFFPVSKRPVVESLADNDQRLEVVRRHGDFSLAYTTAVHGRLRYFGDERGYIAYDLHRLGYVFALGDPVAAPEDRERLIGEFLGKFPRAAFCQISASTAQLVQKSGLLVNEMGVDTVLPLAEYDFQGQHKRWIRQAASWTESRGYTIREDSVAHVGAEQVDGVSSAWRNTRNVKEREVRFLNRPLVVADEPGTRRLFFFDSEKRLLAYVFFDPLYRAGKLFGYVACTKRRHPDAPAQAEQSIMKHAIELFKSEGLAEFRLGLSPLAWIEDREFKSSWMLRQLFQRGFSSPWINRRFYNVQGHAEYKRRYRGREDKVYYATGRGSNLVRLMALVKVCKIV